jgi:hypothetical protein
MTKQKKTTAKPVTRGTKARTLPAEATPAPKTKLGRLEVMLRRAEGATIGQIAKALDWQLHSVRGAISGSLKKKRGLTVVAEKIADGERVYRITSRSIAPCDPIANKRWRPRSPAYAPNPYPPPAPHRPSAKF